MVTGVVDGTSPDRAPVVVAVLTFRREQQLSLLLPTLAAQAAGAGDGGNAVASLVVVDNDPAGSARSVVAALGGASGVRYVHEPTPGLAAARNRALHESADARALVFIDDDETPGEGWLSHLLTQWQEQRPTAVTGPVSSALPTGVDPWVIGTGLFRRHRRATGAPMAGMATNNVLLDMDFVRQHHLRFDARFGLTGGEDSKFGQDLLAAGGTIVWCDEAEVSENVPASRLERRWVRRRLTRNGESWVRVRVVDLAPSTGVTVRLGYLARGTLKTVVGLLGVAWSVIVRSPHGQGRATSVWAGGLGMVRGALGIHWQEYGRA